MHACIPLHADRCCSISCHLNWRLFSLDGYKNYLCLQYIDFIFYLADGLLRYIWLHAYMFLYIIGMEFWAIVMYVANLRPNIYFDLKPGRGGISAQIGKIISIKSRDTDRLINPTPPPTWEGNGLTSRRISRAVLIHSLKLVFPTRFEPLSWTWFDLDSNRRPPTSHLR